MTSATTFRRLVGRARTGLKKVARRVPGVRERWYELPEVRRQLSVAENELRHLRTEVNRARQRLTDIEVGVAASTRRGDPAPSFRYKLAELRRLGQDLAPSLGLAEPVLALDPKDAGYDFARRFGLRVPERLASFSHAQELDLDGLPDRFVLKALEGWSSRGVFLLERAAAGAYRDLSRGGQVLTPSDLADRLQELCDAGLGGSEVIAEELIARRDGRDGSPLDWKLYCFYGEVGMVAVKDAAEARDWRSFRFRWFDDHWNDLGPARLEVRHDPTIPLPAHPDEILEAGRLLSAAIPRPFVRIDLYDTDEGVVFGEVTPHPGALHLVLDDIDRRLGRMWEAAEARLWGEAVRRGDLDIRPGSAPGDRSASG